MMAHRANGMDRKVMIFYLPVNDEPSSRPASIWLPEEKRREEMEDPCRENSHKSLLIPPYVSWFDFNTNWGATPQITCKRCVFTHNHNKTTNENLADFLGQNNQSGMGDPFPVSRSLVVIERSDSILY